MILIFHEKKHTGGGQTYVNSCVKEFTKENIPFDFLEGKLEKSDIKNILFGKYKTAIINIYSIKSLFIVFLLKLSRTKVIIINHGIWLLEFRSQNKYRKISSVVKEVLLNITQGLIFILSSDIVVLSNYSRNLTTSIYPFTSNKIKIISGGVDNSIFKKLDSQEKKHLRNELNLPNNKSILLICSRLERRKSIDLAIDAVSKINKVNRNFLLLVVVPSGEFNQIQIISEIFAQISELKLGEKVHIISGIKSENIHKYFQSADIFIMSSTELETFGLTTLEAIASGTLTIGFDSGATREILTKVSTKLIVNERTAKALADKLNRILSSSKISKNSLINKGLMVSKNMDWQIVLKKLMDLI